MTVKARALQTLEIPVAAEDIESMNAAMFIQMHRNLPTVGLAHLVSCSVFTPKAIHIFSLDDVPANRDEFVEGWVGELLKRTFGEDVVVCGFAIIHQELADWHSHTVFAMPDGKTAEFSLVGPMQLSHTSPGMVRDAIAAARVLWGAAWEPVCAGCGGPFGECREEE